MEILYIFTPSNQEDSNLKLFNLSATSMVSKEIDVEYGKKANQYLFLVVL